MKSALNLRQIEIFRAVMISGSITGAANLMNITQPGVSRTIAMLESKLGYALFKRQGRRIAPTPEAEALYREVEKSYRSIELISEVALDIGMQKAGALRIAVLPALAHWLVPRAIARFLATRPKVKVFFESMPSRQIAELVSTRQLDLGIIELPLFRSTIEIEPLDPIPYVAVIPMSHPLAGQSSISLKELNGERMVLISQHSMVRHQIDNMLSSLGVAPDVAIETPSTSLACSLAAEGVGIALASKWTATPFQGDHVAVLPIREAFGSNMAIIFPELGERLALATAFAQEFRDGLRTDAPPAS
ncbi:LysR family transcriptional regulator [Agrobacterium vaccinii]|uniref:LysR family transcriptional regulator n=1 Tax=Agrobacterium vaccinii TaxID=2735528 RepID=UPI001E5B5BDD|nr:LysR substrate-binding domain-containing protein [Agrobacterium vaccinii]UHS59850.1 LysR family transcriptional regulator [Agrobacterium vaccinii]